MTEMSSSPIQQRTVARQTAEPANPLDGFLWINPEGGANGNNAERYSWNGTGWELLDSTGPDTPLHAAAGASWTDTGNGTSKNYRGGAWHEVGVSDHANLSGLANDDHPHYATDTKVDNHTGNTDAHRHMEAKRGVGSSGTQSISWTSAFASTPLVADGMDSTGSNPSSGDTMVVKSRSTTSCSVYLTTSYNPMVVAMEGT